MNAWLAHVHTQPIQSCIAYLLQLFAMHAFMQLTCAYVAPRDCETEAQGISLDEGEEVIIDDNRSDASDRSHC